MVKKIVGTIALVFVLLTIYSFNGKDRQFTIAKNMDVFSALFKEINESYVEIVNANSLMNKGVGAMLSSLDPYTVYTPEDKIEDYRINNDSEYVGIGALTSRVKKHHVVMMTYKDYPAQEAGLMIGDRILTVDGNSLDNKSDDELRKLIKGQEGTSTQVTVSRYGQSEPIALTIVRKKVDINSVTYEGLVNEGIGYIKLSQFSANCSKDLLEALEKVKEQGATSLVLDLRGNPGGYLHEAVNICNVFLPKGMKVVDTKGKNPIYTNTKSTLNQPVDTEMPLAILIDGKSASASEIVSGVIQDYDRGVLIGERSFGKGLVQKTWKLPYNGQLKATISKYYIPSGRCIQALDYSKKTKSGEATKVVDSLRNVFYTVNKRKVYDGGGISPDTLVSSDKNRTDFVKHLINEAYTIDYANKFFFERQNEKPVGEDFVFSDEDFTDFKNWLKTKSFVYNSSAKVLADTLGKRLINIDNELSEEFTQLGTDLGNAANRFLERDKEQIKFEIAKNIIARYYFEPGLVKYSLSQDPLLVTAKSVLASQEVYNQILD